MTLKNHKNHYNVKFLKGYGHSISVKDSKIILKDNHDPFSQPVIESWYVKNMPYEKIVLQGKGYISTEALSLLSENNRNVILLDNHGKPVTYLNPVMESLTATQYRIAQYDTFRNLEKCRYLSKQIVKAIHHFMWFYISHKSQKNMADQPKQSFIQEFMGFLKTFGIIGLAIAFVIGAAAAKLISAFVVDIINPIIGLALPSGDLKSLMSTVTNSVTGAVSEFKYGDLILNIIEFVVVALIVFIAYKALSKLKLVEDKTKSA